MPSWWKKWWSKLKVCGVFEKPHGFFQPCAGFLPHILIWGKIPAGFYKKLNIKNLSRNKYVWLYSLKKINIKFQFNTLISLRVFSPMLDCGGTTRQVFFWKIQIDFFEIFFSTMQNKRFIKNFQHYIEPLKEKENSPTGFSPAGCFLHKTKWEKNPAQRSILHSVFKIMRVYIKTGRFQFLPWRKS